MSENTTTGGLVEELRALHVRGVEYSCRGCGQDWPCDTTSLLDAHASRTTEVACTDPRCQHGVPGACASAPAGLLGYMWQPDRAESVSSLASSSPEPRLPRREAEFHAEDFAAIQSQAIDGLANYIRQIDGKHQMGAGELAERIVKGWLPPSRLARAYAAREERYA